jgi:hypothetical protein
VFIRVICGKNNQELSMAEPKTKPTKASVKEFLNQLPDKERRDDCFTVAKVMAGLRGTPGVDAEVGQAQHGQVVPLHQTPFRYPRAHTQEIDQTSLKDLHDYTNRSA